MADWNPQANKILLEALNIDDLAERVAYVQQACHADRGLRDAVEELLAAHAEAGAFLENDSPDDAGTLFAPGTTLADRFIVRRELGQGGMGVVYLADQVQPVRRQVAIKLIKSGLDAHNVATRFEQERNALAVMDHPHIARIYEAGIVDLLTGDELVGGKWTENANRAAPFFAMEYLAGVPINDYCDRHKLDLRERLQLFVPVCQAVQHAHQKGIVHRDIKPSNILVESVDKQPAAKIIDFGVAKATGAKLTENTLQTSFGRIVGTLEYMSPEQAEFSEDIDTRTDVYALGAVLYELLVGTVPHKRESLQQAGLAEMLRVIKEDDAIAPSAQLSHAGGLPSIAANRDTIPHKLLRSVKGDLDWILLKALDKDRDRRYPSVTGFANDIQRFLDEEPIAARPPSAIYRLQKAYRRHRAVFIGAAVGLALLICGTIGTSVGFVSAARNAKAAKAEAQRATEAESATREALVEVETERDRAETEQRIASSITDFLLDDLLQQANVSSQAYRLLELDGIDEQELKRNPTILELVDRAALRLAPAEMEQRFPNQPRVQATLLKTIGDVYASIGQAEKALPLLERARQISEQEVGPLDPLTLQSMGVMMSAYYNLRRFDDALHTAKERLDRSIEAYGADDYRTLYAMAGVTTAYSQVKDSKSAIEMGKRALELARTSDGLDANDQAQMEANLKFQLSGAYFRANQASKAAKLCEQVLAYRKTNLGERHPRTLFCASWLSNMYIAISERDKARTLLEELLPKLEELLGADHFQTIAARENLGATYRRLGMLTKAIATYEECVKLRTERFGANDVRTLHVRANLALTYLNNEQVEKAMPNLEEVAAAGWHEPDLLFANTNLIQAYLQNQQFEKAEQLARKYLAHVRVNLADKPMKLRSGLFHLSLTLFSAGNLAAAEPLLRELEPINAKHAPNNWNSFNAKALLGASLLAREEYEEAETLLVDGYEGMRSRYNSIPLTVRHHVSDSVEWLVQLHEARGDAAAAAVWRSKLAELAPPKLATR